MANKNKRSLRSFFTNNTVLKLISLAFAVILWSFVTNSTNPERTKTIEDVSVVIQGVEDLKEKGYVIRDLEKQSFNVKIKVNVKNSDYRKVNKNIVFASIDVSEISRDGVNNIAVTPTFNNSIDVSLDSVVPVAIPLTIDKIAAKEVPVSIKTEGELKENLVSVMPEYTQSILLEGSSYYLEKIENAIVTVDLSSLNDGDLLTPICTYEDKDGVSVNFDGKKIDVDMDIQTKKEVSINAAESVTNADKLASGYQFNGISTGKITLCGHSDKIASITEIKAKAIDLTGKDSTFVSAPLELILPDGVSVLPGQEVPPAKIDISQQKKTIKLNRYLTVTGLSPELNASITSVDQSVLVASDGQTAINTSITLTGPKLILDNIKETDVIVRLSLLDKGAGTYELSPVVGLSPTFASTVTAHLDSPTQVLVSITKPN